MENEIGIRELKNQLTQVMRAVREHGTEYTVTWHGEPIAVLSPIMAREKTENMDDRIEEEIAFWERLAQEFSASWSSTRSPREQLEEMREEEASWP